MDLYHETDSYETVKNKESLTNDMKFLHFSQYVLSCKPENLLKFKKPKHLNVIILPSVKQRGLRPDLQRYVRIRIST